MAIQAYKFTLASAVVLLATTLASPLAYAQCGCMSGGGDAPKSASSSGASVPNAIDLVRDPTWQAHEYTWQGGRYMQINNTTNGANVALLQVNATGWVIQTDAQSAVTGRTVYRDSKIEVIQYRQFDQDHWIVRPVE